MIPGVAASQFGAAVAGGGVPAFVPTGAVVHIDLINEQYYAGGVERSVGEVLDGTYTVAADGIEITSGNSATPKLSSVALGDINTLIDDGFLICVEFSLAGSSGIDGPLAIFLDTNDDASYSTEWKIEQWIDGSSVIFWEANLESDFLGDTPLSLAVAGTNRVAALFGRSFGPGRATANGISVNGSVVSTGGAFGPTRYMDWDGRLANSMASIGGVFFGHRDSWRHDAMKLRKVTIYPATELWELEVASGGATPAVLTPSDEISAYRLNVNFDGTDGATTATDASPSAHTLTFSGDAQLDTAQQYEGSASLYLQATTAGSVVTIPDSADWVLPANSVIDVWVRFEDLADQQCIVAQWAGAGSNRNFRLSKLGGSTAVIRFERTSGGSPVTFNSSSLSWATGVWYRILVTHVNLYRTSDTPTGYITIERQVAGAEMVNVLANGSGYTDLTDASGATGNLTIGEDGDGNLPFKGWIDNLKIYTLDGVEIVEPSA